MPLLVHSAGSLLWGTSPPGDLVRRARADGRAGLALTDRDNLYLAVPALAVAEESGLPLLLGAEVTLPAAAGPDRPAEGTAGHPVSALVYVLDLSGYAGLCEIVTGRKLDGDFRLSEALAAQSARGGIFVATEFPSLLASLAETVGRDRLGALVVRGGRRSPERERALRRIAGRHGLQVLGTPQITLLDPRDEALHRVLVACRKGGLVSQVDAGECAGAWGAWPAAGAVADLWRDDPTCLVRSRDLLERGRLSYKDLARRRPILPRSDDADGSYDRLYRMCHEGLVRRYPTITPRVARRLHDELAVIRDLGFVDYFLVVGAIISEARRRRIPTVGRGSGAGSIVSYALGITNVDPIRYGLYFERFLHRLRKDLPDLDIDFCWKRRDEIIDWVYEAYGADRVAMISTHNTFHPRSAFREAAKALGIPHGVVNRLCRAIPRSIPSEPGSEGRGDGGPADGGAALARAIRAAPLGHRIPLDDPPYPDVLRMADRLLGLPRHLGIHPGGIVISDGPLAREVPLERAAKGVVVTQYEMRAVESVGLVKIDLLGNRALSTLAEAGDVLAAGGEEIDWDTVRDDDPQTGLLLGSGGTLGCFQLESPGMRQLLIMTRARDLEGALHALALIRPGPAGSGMKEAFVRRVRGEEPASVRDPRLRSLLASTRGVMLYEEDVMCVASAVGGFSLEIGDLLRRAIGAARAVEAGNVGPPADDPWHGRSLDQLEDLFLRRAVAGGAGIRAAGEVWSDLVRFGAYAFCKAHAAGYAVLAYRTAYLKARHPGPFAAALMNNHQGMYPLWVHVEEARRRGLPIRPPCVHESRSGWTWEAGGLRCGLGQIAGLSGATVSAVLRERGTGPFASLAEVWRRTGASMPEMEALVRAGALSDVPPGDATAHLWSLYRRGARGRPAGPSGPSLPLGPSPPPSPVPAAERPSPWERVRTEMEVLGVAVTCHPMEALRGEGRLDGMGLGDSRDLERGGGRLAGCVAATRRVETSRGDAMVFITLDDEFGTVECVAWPAVYRDAVRALAAGRILAVEGTVQSRHGASTLEVASLRAVEGGAAL